MKLVHFKPAGIQRVNVALRVSLPCLLWNRIITKCFQKPKATHRHDTLSAAVPHGASVSPALISSPVSATPAFCSTQDASLCARRVSKRHHLPFQKTRTRMLARPLATEEITRLFSPPKLAFFYILFKNRGVKPLFFCSTPLMNSYPIRKEMESPRAPSLLE